MALDLLVMCIAGIHFHELSKKEREYVFSECFWMFESICKCMGTGLSMGYLNDSPWKTKRNWSSIEKKNREFVFMHKKNHLIETSFDKSK